MKRYINIAITFVLGVFALVSCNYLEPDNKKFANQTAEDVLSKDPGVLRVYAYSLLQPIASRVDVYEEGVDLYMPSNKKTGTGFDQYTITPEDDNVKEFYSSLYACINMANACMAMDNEGLYHSEMKFVRCYCYYLLTQHFGSVPYVTKYINNAGREYAKMPLDDLYSALIAELDAIANDEKFALSDTKGAASRRAANALLAKVYLAAGWDLHVSMTNEMQGVFSVQDKSYFAKALEAAKAAIGEQKLSLSFEDKWSPSREGNEEVIFAVQYERGGFPGDLKKGGHGLQNTFGSYYGDCAGTGEKYCNGLHASNPKSSYLWAVQDERYDGTFMTTMYNSLPGGWGTEGYYAYYNVADRTDLPVAMRVFPGTAGASVASSYRTQHAAQLTKGECVNDPQVMVMSYPKLWVNGSEMDYYEYVQSDPGMFAAPVVKKFDDPQSQNISLNMTSGYRDIVVLHLSDIYLVAAEAALMSDNKSNSEDFINAVRKRGYGDAWNESRDKVSYASYASLYRSCYPGFKNADIDLVLDERARELYAEGHRWMDLRRTKQLARYTNLFNFDLAGKAEGRVKWYRPIPQAEINSNQLLTDADQNPGY